MSAEDSSNGEHTGHSSWAGGGTISGMLSGSRIGALTTFHNTKKPKKEPTYKQLKDEFMAEMRYLSKLRHPCVTTVMGKIYKECFRDAKNA